MTWRKEGNLHQWVFMSLYVCHFCLYFDFSLNRCDPTPERIPDSTQKKTAMLFHTPALQPLNLCGHQESRRGVSRVANPAIEPGDASWNHTRPRPCPKQVGPVFLINAKVPIAFVKSLPLLQRSVKSSWGAYCIGRPHVRPII